MVDLWANKSPEEAHEILSQPDVKVTNASDKDVQLGKLIELNVRAKSRFVSWHASPISPTSLLDVDTLSV